jgi:hypothetical protein
MTERRAWLKAAELLVSGEETYVCYAARAACGFKGALYGGELPPMLSRMKEAASKWAFRLQRAKYRPGVCLAAFNENSDKTQRRRIAFCRRMAGKVAKKSAARKLQREEGR